MRKLIMLMMCFSTLGIFAQGSVEGKLTNHEGETLDQASIKILKSGELIKGTACNIDGEYNISNLKAGIYDIEITNMGKITGIEQIKITDRETLVYNAEVNTAKEIGGVTVIGYSSLLNRYEPTVDITKAEVITETGIKDPEKILGLGTGVSKNKEGQISFRGSRPGAANYYIDGISVQGNIGIPTSAIYSMKVYNGGMPAKFGNSTGAVVEVRTKSYFDYFD